MFSIIYEPVHGIIYKNSKKEKRVMRHSEIHKFCDATLNRVLEGLKSYNNDVKFRSASVRMEQTLITISLLALANKAYEVIMADKATMEHMMFLLIEAKSKKYIDEEQNLLTVAYRKAEMAKHSDASIALPEPSSNTSFANQSDVGFGGRLWMSPQDQYVKSSKEAIPHRVLLMAH
ncbi:hypothetical protein Tco_0405155 [Tanacetum coccineum]